MNLDNVVSLREWKRPTNETQVHSFLGLGGYFRQFIEKFSLIPTTLIKLTRKIIKLLWTYNFEWDFLTFKDRLTNTLILVFPMRGGKLMVYTYASGTILGVVLMLACKVVAYASR